MRPCLNIRYLILAIHLKKVIFALLYKIHYSVLNLASFSTFFLPRLIKCETIARGSYANPVYLFQLASKSTLKLCRNAKRSDTCSSVPVALPSLPQLVVHEYSNSRAPPFTRHRRFSCGIADEWAFASSSDAHIKLFDRCRQSLDALTSNEPCYKWTNG